MTAPSGLVVVDKPSGMTSHDVVARVRRLAGTRRVGHAGTLDPMATGVLVVGVEKATRLLGYLTLTEKTYVATIRLGQSTSTDDAEGEPASGSPATDIAPGALDAEIAELTGDIWQVPPGVSAIKVNGQRAYKLTRAGEAPELAARPVTVYEFTVTGISQTGDFLDINAEIRCSSGTYIRALARDLGAALGTGGHLTALRRTAVGPYRLEQAHSLEELAELADQRHQTPDLERSVVTPRSHNPLPRPIRAGRSRHAPSGGLSRAGRGRHAPSGGPSHGGRYPCCPAHRLDNAAGGGSRGGLPPVRPDRGRGPPPGPGRTPSPAACRAAACRAARGNANSRLRPGQHAGRAGDRRFRLHPLAGRLHRCAARCPGRMNLAPPRG